jgi:hypothetical protein
MKQYDQVYAKALREQVDPAEAERYAAMQPLRWYMMKNYQIVRTFNEEVLFRHK